MTRMRKTTVYLLAASISLALSASAHATLPGSNSQAFMDCDVALCLNSEGGLDYNLYGEDTRLFESLSISNLHRGSISVDRELAGLADLQSQVNFYCLSKREGSRLAHLEVSRGLDWKALTSKLSKCGHRAGQN